MIEIICRKTWNTCRKAVALLKEKEIEFNYREYVENPLSETEIRRVLNMLGKSAKELLRKNDKAYKQLGLSGQEDEEQLISYMAEFPTLIQRRIGIKGNKAVLGRPVERLLEL